MRVVMEMEGPMKISNNENNKKIFIDFGFFFICLLLLKVW